MQVALTLKVRYRFSLRDNIGTTLTVIIAAAGANVSAKRVAATHVTFNVLGTILCLIL